LAKWLAHHASIQMTMIFNLNVVVVIDVGMPCEQSQQRSGPPVDWSRIEARKQQVLKLRQSSTYAKQKSSVEKEFVTFLEKAAGDKDTSQLHLMML